MVHLHISYFKTKPGIAKTTTLLVGIAVIVLACHSFYNSAWVGEGYYKICDDLQLESCADIMMEKVFIGSTLFCNSLSLFLLLLSLLSRQMSERAFKLVDVGLHGFCALLTIITGSLFIYSAKSIDTLFQDIDIQSGGASMSVQSFVEKIAAGSLSIFQGILYSATAVILILDK